MALLISDDKGFSIRTGIFSFKKSSAFSLCLELGVAIIAPSGLHFLSANSILEKYRTFSFFENS